MTSEVSLRDYLESRMATLERLLSGIDHKLDSKVDVAQFAKLEIRVDELVRLGSQHAQNAERIAVEAKVAAGQLELRVAELHEASIRRDEQARTERNGIAQRLDEKYRVRTFALGALALLSGFGTLLLAFVR